MAATRVVTNKAGRCGKGIKNVMRQCFSAAGVSSDSKKGKTAKQNTFLLAYVIDRTTRSRQMKLFAHFRLYPANVRGGFASPTTKLYF